MTTKIIKNNTPIGKLPLYDGLQLVRELMGKNEIQVDVDLPGVLLSPIGSYIEIKNKRYTVNTPPLRVEKLGDHNYKYSLMFESVLYRLYDKKLRHLGNRTFQFYGNLTRLAQLIVDNINEIDPGWTVGVCDDVPEKKIDFSGHTCRTALDTGAEAFGVEWDVNEKEIRFVKQVGRTTTHVFKYGMGKGLYNLSYAYQNDKNVVTRAYGYGSIKNLPENYRDGATQLMFDGFYLQAPNVINDEDVKEGDYENNDIFPEVNGLVSAAPAWILDAETFTITDETLDFDLNDYFSTKTAQLSFKSGELQGQDFDIKRYVHATKTITLKTFVDGNNNTLPREGVGAAVGDTYSLFDMHLPAERVAEAEERLRVATQEFLNENCVPRVLYSMELDPLYARDNGIMLEPGDKVTIIDEALGINELIRVTKVSYPYNFPEVLTSSTKINIEIANFIPYTITERIISDTIDNKQEIKIVDRTNAERARMNSLNMKLLSGRIFDPDGNLAKGAETLYAGMAVLGFDSQNFGLLDVTINANNGGDPNALVISGGKLSHRTYEIEGLGSEWVISGNSWSGLDPAKFYYAYAKCDRHALTGTWEISDTEVAFSDFVGFWAFNLGQLYEVNTDGYRDFDFTKGMTFIVGDRITSGLIQSIDKQNFINLNKGSFEFKTPLSRISFNETEEGLLELWGKIIATDAEFINLVVQNLRTGKVRITAEDNNIRIVDDLEQDIVAIDNDVANEGNSVYGSGMRIGRIGEIPASTTSAKGFYIYAADGTELSFIRGDANVNSIGMFTKSGLQVDGLSNLNNLTIRGSISPGVGLNVIDYQNDFDVDGSGYIRMKWVKGLLVSQQAIG